MDVQRFEKYLKETGRKPNVIKRYINIVSAFEEFLKSRPIVIQDVNNADATNLKEYVEIYEQQSRKSARTVLYAFVQYFKACENSKMALAAQKLREPRKAKQGPFPLKEFLDIDPDAVTKLAKIGIKNVDQMRTSGRTGSRRLELAKKAGISPNTILELVQLSDLVRVGYVKKKFTRLFHNAGIKSPEDLAKWEVDNLYDHLNTYILESGWEGIAPYKSDLRNYIESAKKLSRDIEYTDKT
ncbi:MAG: DUF4332 domain-containing protein [Candidatus Heimdallarchaeota archaeon]